MNWNAFYFCRISLHSGRRLGATVPRGRCSSSSKECSHPFTVSKTLLYKTIQYFPCQLWRRHKNEPDRQGQANEFVLLLWTQEDSGFTTGPITVTQTLKTVFYKILETRVQIPLTLFGFVSLDLGLWLWTGTCQLLKLQIVSYIHCWQEEINFYL